MNYELGTAGRRGDTETGRDGEKGQKAGWLIRKLVKQMNCLLLTAYCAKHREPACPACPGHSPGEPVEGLTV
jgi:hypothetical protein